MKFADLDLDKVYTYADYYKWKFEERVELIKGRIFKMSPAPNRMHQVVAGKIHIKIGVFLNNNPCQVYMAPFDVRLPRKSKDDKDIITVLQPDLCVICDPSKLDSRGCVGAPDIVVEVLSPSNNKKELQNKYEVYEESGIKEYWVVMPSEKTMLVYTLTNGKYVPSRLMVSGDLITSSVLPGFSMDLTDVFSGYGEDEG
jgi:Uma2 family endonuclease